jgi:NAD-dependent SIR2 family protein deacetylase
MATEDTSDFECGICSARFGQNDHLREHIINTHENIKNFKCSICAKLYLQKPTVNGHEKIAQHFECDICSAKIAQSFECDICSTTFDYNFHLQQHIEVAHNNLKKFHSMTIAIKSLDIRIISEGTKILCIKE